MHVRMQACGTEQGVYQMEHLEGDGGQQAVKGRLAVSGNNDKLVTVSHSVGVPHFALHIHSMQGLMLSHTTF